MKAPRLITVDGKVVEFGGHATAQKVADAYMRSTGLTYKRGTTHVKAETVVLEGLGADARARMYYRRHGTDGILLHRARQAHAACRRL